MTRKISVGFVAGLAVGVVATIVMTGGRGGVPAFAQAQAQPPASVQRYQISSWSSSAARPGDPPAASVGAFIVDTQRGAVWMYSQSEGLKSVGRVE